MAKALCLETTERKGAIQFGSEVSVSTPGPSAIKRVTVSTSEHFSNNITESLHMKGPINCKFYIND